MEGGRVLRFMLTKAYTAVNEVLKSKSGDDSEREGCRENVSPLREYLSGGE